MDNDTTRDDMSDSTFDIVSHPSLDPSDDEQNADETASNASFINGPEDEEPETFINEEDTDNAQEQELPASGSLADTMVEERLSSPSLNTSRIRIHPPTSKILLDTACTCSKAEESDHARLESKNSQDEIIQSAMTPKALSSEGSYFHTTSTDYLQLDGPFQVIYHGNQDVKDEIIEKVAQAIAASRKQHHYQPNLSSYVIVPVSSFFWEKGGNQRVELVPSTSMALNVFDSTFSILLDGPAMTKNELKFRTLDAPSSRFRGTESFNASKVEHTSKPQVAIFVHDDFGDSLHLRFQSDQLVERGVPVIQLFFNQRSELRSIQPSDSKSNEDLALEAKPIRNDCSICASTITEEVDVQEFLAVDADQLNRYLANLISKRKGTRPSMMQSFSKMSGTIFSTIARYMHLCTNYYQFLLTRTETCRSKVLGRMEYVLAPTRFTRAAVLNAGLLGIISMLVSLVAIACSPYGMSSANSVADLQSFSLQHLPVDIASVAVPTHSQKATSTVTVSSLGSVPSPFGRTGTTAITTTSLSCNPRAAKDRREPDFHLVLNGTQILLQSSAKVPKKWQASERSIHVFQGADDLRWTLDQVNETTYQLTIDPVTKCDPFTVQIGRYTACPREYSVPNPACPGKGWFGPPLRNLIGYTPPKRIADKPEQPIPVPGVVELPKNKAMKLLEQQTSKARELTTALLARSNSIVDDTYTQFDKSIRALHKSVDRYLVHGKSTQLQEHRTTPNDRPKNVAKRAGKFEQLIKQMNQAQNSLVDELRANYMNVGARIMQDTAKMNHKVQHKVDEVSREIDARMVSLRSEIDAVQAKFQQLISKPPKMPAQMKVARDRAHGLANKVSDKVSHALNGKRAGQLKDESKNEKVKRPWKLNPSFMNLKSKRDAKKAGRKTAGKVRRQI